MVQTPGHLAIDLTPDVVALLDGVQIGPRGFESGKESIEPAVHGRDVPTGVHFL